MRRGTFSVSLQTYEWHPESSKDLQGLQNNPAPISLDMIDTSLHIISSIRQTFENNPVNKQATPGPHISRARVKMNGSVLSTIQGIHSLIDF